MNYFWGRVSFIFRSRRNIIFIRKGNILTNHTENLISNKINKSSFIFCPKILQKEIQSFLITEEIPYISVFFWKTIFSKHFEKSDMAFGELQRRRL